MHIREVIDGNDGDPARLTKQDVSQGIAANTAKSVNGNVEHVHVRFEVLLQTKLRISLVPKETNSRSTGYDGMEKKEKLTPEDSAHRPRKDEQAVTKKPRGPQGPREAKTAAPALKRKFSEQPPTKHHSKT